MSQRDHWGSRLGFVLAAAGSAVGLGNLWKFPYIAWNNHGGAFVYVYLVCIAVVGLPLMMAEILIGRRAQTSPVPAFGVLGFKKWAFVGWLGVIAGVVILAFYVVIAGWSLSSLANCLNWSFNGYKEPAPDEFGQFVSSGGTQIILALSFLLMTAIIVSRGVSKGIEKATKIMMPALFIIMVYLVINSIGLEGFSRAMGFLFKPNFNELEPHGILEALGHAFFTLSLGMGAMVTYGSYMQKSDSVTRSATYIVVLDTIIAMTACVIMYSIIFSVPTLEAELSDPSHKVGTAGMLFVTLPQMFYEHMSAGAIVGPVFYILVAFAALTSTISLLEVVTALLVDKLKMQRTKATFSAAGGIGLLTICAALSLGASKFFTDFHLFGPIQFLNNKVTANKSGVLNILDHVSANWFLPVGGFLFAIFVGWVFKKKDSLDELGLVDSSGNTHWFFHVWYFLVRYVCPVVIGIIIIAIFWGKDFS